MSDTNEREEFEKWEVEYGTPDQNAWDGWQARGELEAKKLEASDARYQARVCELEETLADLVDLAEPAMNSANADGASYEVDEELAVARRLLSTTTPDTALQRKVLEAMIDEQGLASSAIRFNPKDRLKELRAQLASLNRNETLGE